MACQKMKSPVESLRLPVGLAMVAVWPAPSGTWLHSVQSARRAEPEPITSTIFHVYAL
jgi:hypothetical protein